MLKNYQVGELWTEYYHPKPDVHGIRIMQYDGTAWKQRTVIFTDEAYAHQLVCALQRVHSDRNTFIANIGLKP